MDISSSNPLPRPPSPGSDGSCALLLAHIGQLRPPEIRQFQGKLDGGLAKHLHDREVALVLFAEEAEGLLSASKDRLSQANPTHSEDLPDRLAFMVETARYVRAVALALAEGRNPPPQPASLERWRLQSATDERRDRPSIRPCTTASPPGGAYHTARPPVPMRAPLGFPTGTQPVEADAEGSPGLFRSSLGKQLASRHQVTAVAPEVRWAAPLQSEERLFASRSMERAAPSAAVNQPVSHGALAAITSSRASGAIHAQHANRTLVVGSGARTVNLDETSTFTKVIKAAGREATNGPVNHHPVRHAPPKATEVTQHLPSAREAVVRPSSPNTSREPMQNATAAQPLMSLPEQPASRVSDGPSRRPSPPSQSVSTSTLATAGSGWTPIRAIYPDGPTHDNRRTLVLSPDEKVELWLQTKSLVGPTEAKVGVRPPVHAQESAHNTAREGITTTYAPTPSVKSPISRVYEDVPVPTPSSTHLTPVKESSPIAFARATTSHVGVSLPSASFVSSPSSRDLPLGPFAYPQRKVPLPPMPASIYLERSAPRLTMFRERELACDHLGPHRLPSGSELSSSPTTGFVRTTYREPTAATPGRCPLPSAVEKDPESFSEERVSRHVTVQPVSEECRGEGPSTVWSRHGASVEYEDHEEYMSLSPIDPGDESVYSTEVLDIAARRSPSPSTQWVASATYQSVPSNIGREWVPNPPASSPAYSPALGDLVAGSRESLIPGAFYSPARGGRASPVPEAYDSEASLEEGDQGSSYDGREDILMSRSPAPSEAAEGLYDDMAPSELSFQSHEETSYPTSAHQSAANLHYRRTPAHLLMHNAREGTSRFPSPAALELPPLRIRAPSVICTICQEDIYGRIVRLPCGDTCDVACFRELLVRAIDDESLFPPKCCKTPIERSDVERYLGRAFADRFQRKEREFSTANRVYCSVPRCSAFLGAATAFSTPLRCPDCASHTCGSCKQQAHRGSPCRSSPDDSAVLRLGNEHGWKRCPSCQHLIELAVGCYHVQCRCGKEFCYMCGVSWKGCNCDLFYVPPEEEEGVERAMVAPPVAAPRAPAAAIRAAPVAREEGRVHNAPRAVPMLVERATVAPGPPALAAPRAPAAGMPAAPVAREVDYAHTHNVPRGAPMGRPR